MDTVLNKKEGNLLAARIAKDAGVTLSKCYQCGKCTAGCPMADSYDLMPRQIVHYMQLGEMTRILKSKTIWLCASCHTCTERCPNEINVSGLIEGARIEANRLGICAVKEVKLFNDIFMNNVKEFGKSQEVILEGLYNVKSGHLTQDMANVPKMLSKKIVRAELNQTDAKHEVKEIINKSQEGGIPL